MTLIQNKIIKTLAKFASKNVIDLNLDLTKKMLVRRSRRGNRTGRLDV